MRPIRKIASTASIVVLAAGLAACASSPMPPYQQTNSYPSYPTTSYPSNTYPSNTYPSNTYPTSSTPAYSEFGRVANIEVIQPAQRSTSGVGTVLGAVAGGVLGNQIGGGSGRAIATGAGVIGGAVAGNAIEGRTNGNRQATGEVARVSIQTDNGAYRSYDMSGPTGLRVGDRVRIENGQIFRL